MPCPLAPLTDGPRLAKILIQLCHCPLHNKPAEAIRSARRMPTEESLLRLRSLSFQGDKDGDLSHKNVFAGHGTALPVYVNPSFCRGPRGVDPRP